MTEGLESGLIPWPGNDRMAESGDVDFGLAKSVHRISKDERCRLNDHLSETV